MMIEIQEEKTKPDWALKERVKELTCLEETSHLVENTNLNLNEILKKFVLLIPPGWQYPDITCSRIRIDGQVSETPNFKKTPWKQSADLMVGGERKGVLEIFYLEERPERDEGPFLKEERRLIDLLVEKLGNTIHNKRIEEELRQNEKRLNYIIENLGAGFVIVDKKRTITYANPAWAKILGYKPEELIGNPANIFTHPESLTIGELEYQKRGIGESSTYEKTLISKNGKPVPILNAVQPIFDNQGQYDGLYAVSVDLTERNKMEEELRRYSEHLEELVEERAEALRGSEKKYRDLVELAHDGIILLTGSDRIITFSNPRMAEMLGYSVEELIGKSYLELVYPDDKKEVFRLIKSRIETGMAYVHERRLIKKDGSTLYTLLSVASTDPAIRDLSTPTIAILTDITERKKMEQELENARRFVTIGETTAIIGHDLRNPLQAIVLTTQLMRMKYEAVSSPAMKQGLDELLERIETRAIYMNKIVSDLQDYARSLKPKLVETSLRKLIDESLSTVQVPENVEVSIPVEEGQSSRLRVDPPMMRRALTNLITNAVQAMPEGGQLTIRSSATEDAALISVQDTGVGIPEENLGRLFEPLFTTKAQGMGLGLSVCRRLVEAHNGTITVESKVGEGSTFTVKIPFRRRVS